MILPTLAARHGTHHTPDPGHTTALGMSATVPHTPVYNPPGILKALVSSSAHGAVSTQGFSEK